MKVLFLTKHEYLGASSRYRTLQYLPYLKNMGVYYKISPLFRDTYLKYKYQNGHENRFETFLSILNRIKVILIYSSKYDLLVIEKELLPYFPPFLEILIKLKKIPFILDYDDAVWHNYDKNKSWYFRKFLINKFPFIIRNAELVICGSNYILDYASLFTKKLYKIPTVIDINRYRTNDFHSEHKFVVGWIGSPSSSKYLTTINNVLKEFSKNASVKIHLVGFNNNLKPYLDFKCNIIEWSEETEIQEIKKFDVGIMPLPDTSFERGKCGFKLVQYMGCSKPVIASPVGENKIIVEHGINGFLANSESEWLTFLNLLFKDKKRAQLIGQQGFLKVLKSYSLSECQKDYLNGLKKGFTNKKF